MANETTTMDVNEGKRRSVLRLVEEALQTLQLDVKSGSCADFTRLLQLQRELKKEEDIENVRKIEVTWVDPVPETECCTEK
jgi:hypothetical protein